MGGIGSYALWNDSETIGGQTISSGELTITPSGAATWWDVSDITPGSIADIATFDIVPGDIIEYRAAYAIAASGANLKATLVADPTQITGSAALLAAVSTTLTATGLDGGPIIYTVTDADAGETTNVIVRFTFNPLTTGIIAQNESITLANFKLTLQQVRP